MLKDKIVFTGLEIEVNDLVGREVSAPWPNSYYRVIVSRKNLSHNFNLVNIRLWLSNNTACKYGVLQITNNYTGTESYVVSFENPNEAMIFKLSGIEQIDKESPLNDFF